MYILEIWPRFHYFLANFLLRMRRNDQNSTSGQIFNPKFEIPMSCFIVEYEFWWRDLYVLERKTVFRNAKFRHLGASGGGGDFFDETPKRHILGWFHTFWAIDRANPFTVFFFRRAHETRDTTKSDREVIFHLFTGIPTQRNSTKIGVSVGVADIINHTKFGNDRSTQYKVMEGQMLPCSIGMACRL